MDKLSKRAQRFYHRNPTAYRELQGIKERGTLPCPKCRAEVALGSRICPECGVELRLPWWRRKTVWTLAVLGVLGMVGGLGAWWWSLRVPECGDPVTAELLSLAFDDSAFALDHRISLASVLASGEHPGAKTPQSRKCYGILLLSDKQEWEVDYRLDRDVAGFWQVRFARRE
ncbi:MAG: hypothetical protein CL919_01375 [Deltaproteobacteria bacterium]|nr:hypothetical protein [Deltaproteobacteria bacterium]